MKVAVIADFPLSVLEGAMLGRGGGQSATWLPQLAQAWEHQTGCEIHWCVLDRTAGQRATIRKWNQVFHRLPTPGISASMALGRWPQRLAYRRLLRDIRPDLIHCWGTETLYGAALWEFEGPSILSMQGIITPYMRAGDLRGWRWRLFRHWEPHSIRRATVVTSESQWGLDRVAELEPGKPVKKIEYGVFPGYYEVPWEPDPERPRILFAGGLNRLKGADILLEMLRRHPARPWTLVFAGGGSLETPLRALRDPKIEVLGVLRTEQIQEQMAKAWALVHPARADTSPNVVKEARVIGLPVVASPHGGHAEYVRHGVDGWIVGSEDPDDWFEALRLASGDFATCRRFGGENREHFRSHFRAENTASSFLALYREMSGDQPGSDAPQSS